MIHPLDTDNLLTRISGFCYDQLRISVDEDAHDIVNSYRWWHSMHEFDALALDQHIHDILTDQVRQSIQPDEINQFGFDLDPNETITIIPTFNLDHWI